ncbi:MAG: carboxypeptidase-like regulatory domain-containing protein, partial [Bacteroidota bacterium]|nr:carboxypeptidase-like regulatory domain-containing protein [Bacteroidota bacterium]
MNKIAHGFLAAIGASIIVICVTLAFSRSLGERGSIHATVIDAATGARITHAIVRIVETRQGSLTNDKGEATFSLATPGIYTVIGKYSGYMPDTIKNVFVSEGKTTEVAIALTARVGDSTSRLMISNGLVLSDAALSDAAKGGFSVQGSKGTANSERINTGGSGDVLAPSSNGVIGKSKVSAFAAYEVEAYAPPPPVRGEFN